MSNQLYYAISGFFTLLIGLPLAFNPIILVPLYYLITKLVFKVFNKTPTELDNIKNNILEKLTLKHIIATISYYGQQCDLYSAQCRNSYGFQDRLTRDKIRVGNANTLGGYIDHCQVLLHNCRVSRIWSA